MQVNYKAFIDRMINKYEGGYCWDKGDPGGPTKFGITCFDLAEHRHQKMTSMTAWAPIVRDMTLAEAEDIYKIKYASAILFDALPTGIDCVMMDYGVNSGIARPPRVANALFNLPQRAHMTNDLMDQITKCDPKWFIDSMCQERLHYMHQIRNGTAWEQFGKGWGARVNDLDVYADHLADHKADAAPHENAPAAPDLSNVPTPKAIHKADPPTKTTLGGAASSAAAAKAAGFPTWQILTAASLVLVAGGAYYIYKEGKAVKANSTVLLPPGVIIKPAVGA